MSETKRLIEFLGDTIDYLGLYSPDKNGMIHTGFTLNQIAMLTEIRDRLEKDYIHEQNIINYGTGEPNVKVTRGEIGEHILKHYKPGKHADKEGFKSQVFAWCAIFEEFLKSKGLEVGE